MEVCNSDIRGGVCDKGRWVYDEGEVGALRVEHTRVCDSEHVQMTPEGCGKGRGCVYDTQVCVFVRRGEVCV